MPGARTCASLLRRGAGATEPDSYALGQLELGTVTASLLVNLKCMVMTAAELVGKYRVFCFVLILLVFNCVAILS